MEEMRNSYRMLFTIPEKKVGHRSEEHVKINLEGMEFECMVWIQLAHAGITCKYDSRKNR
jgi:hypothetical protein